VVANFQLSAQSLTTLPRLLGIVPLRGQVCRPWVLRTPIENHFLVHALILATVSHKQFWLYSHPASHFVAYSFLTVRRAQRCFVDFETCSRAASVKPEYLLLYTHICQPVHSCRHWKTYGREERNGVLEKRRPECYPLSKLENFREPRTVRLTCWKSCHTASCTSLERNRWVRACDCTGPKVQRASRWDQPGRFVVRGCVRT
jgi:hypothetical protein